MTRPEPALRIILASPRGFCAGVERAVEIVQRALEVHGAPVYVRHEIVHNHLVVEDLRQRGAIFVREVDEIPPGAVTVFSAHGVSRKVEGAAKLRSLDVLDATCPLVKKVHNEGRRYAEDGYDVILIGHRGHPEVEGTQGQIGGPVHVLATVAEAREVSVRDRARVAYITQTTLSPDETRDVIRALTERFPAIVGPDTRDICYATQNRQRALLQLAERSQMLLVVGAANSSNSNRLRELGEKCGVPTYLIGQPSAIDPAWLEGVSTVGLTAGASAPEVLVQGAIEMLRSIRPAVVETLDGPVETVRFRLPQRLSGAQALVSASKM